LVFSSSGLPVTIVYAQIFLQGLQGSRGQPGLPGINGTQGIQGPQGPPGKAAQKEDLIVKAVDGNVSIIHGTAKSVATCNSSSLITSGGFSIKNGAGIVFNSGPSGNSWIVTAATPPGTRNTTLQAHAERAELAAKD
jgi:hypothetical protein